MPPRAAVSGAPYRPGEFIDLNLAGRAFLAEDQLTVAPFMAGSLRQIILSKEGFWIFFLHGSGSWILTLVFNFRGNIFHLTVIIVQESSVPEPSFLGRLWSRFFGSSIWQILAVLRSRWSRYILSPGAGAEIILIINIFCNQFGGWYYYYRTVLSGIMWL